MQSNSDVNNSEQRAENIQSNALIIPKQSRKEFIITELCIYASQIVMFFFVAVFTSNFLQDEKQLLEYMSSKMHNKSLLEIGATMLAIAVVLGIIVAIAKAAPISSLLERLADEVLGEAPRTVYFFGSNVTGILLAASLFMCMQPTVQPIIIVKMLFIAFLAALVGFAYGCSFAYAFKHKAFIKAQAKDK